MCARSCWQQLQNLFVWSIILQVTWFDLRLFGFPSPPLGWSLRDRALPRDWLPQLMCESLTPQKPRGWYHQGATSTHCCREKIPLTDPLPPKNSVSGRPGQLPRTEVSHHWLNQRILPSIFCKEHRDKTEVPDPLVGEDLISYKCRYKLNNRRKLARLIGKYWKIYTFTCLLYNHPC